LGTMHCCGGPGAVGAGAGGRWQAGDREACLWNGKTIVSLRGCYDLHKASGVIIHPPLPTMFFAPVFAALVASAQIASVFASNGTSLLRIIPRDNLIGLKFARRQGDTCPPNNQPCTDGTGCCPTGTTCSSDGIHCNVACGPSDPLCGDGCCDGSEGATCSGDQCIVGGGPAQPPPSSPATLPAPPPSSDSFPSFSSVPSLVSGPALFSSSSTPPLVSGASPKTSLPSFSAPSAQSTAQVSASPSSFPSTPNGSMANAVFSIGMGTLVWVLSVAHMLLQL